MTLSETGRGRGPPTLSDMSQCCLSTSTWLLCISVNNLDMSLATVLRHTGRRAIMFSRCPSVRPSVRSLVCYQSCEDDVLRWSEALLTPIDWHTHIHKWSIRNSQLGGGGTDTRRHVDVAPWWWRCPVPRWSRWHKTLTIKSRIPLNRSCVLLSHVSWLFSHFFMFSCLFLSRQ